MNTYLSAQHQPQRIRFRVLSAIISQCLLVSALQASGDQTLQSAPTLAGPVAAYSFDEGMGNTVTDASGHGNNGTITGATWTQGHFGMALSFIAPDWVTVNDSNSLDLTSGMTLEAWVFPTAVSTTWTTVIFKEQPEVNNQVYGLYGGSPSLRPLIDVYTDGIHELYGPLPLPINEWTFLAATYDTAGGLTIWINSKGEAHSDITGNMVTSTGPLRIGGNSLFSEFFMGIIDNVRIYDRAISQSEIFTDMITPVGGPAPSPTPGVTPTPTPTPSATPAPSVTPSPTPTGPCVFGPNYWARNTGAWCLTSIQLGCITYTQSEAVAIIRHDSSHDKTYTLAKQLIAAKLNIACQNTNSSCVTNHIAAADSWLCSHPIGSGVLANSSAWKMISKVNTALERYNAGTLCAPSCGTSP